MKKLIAITLGALGVATAYYAVNHRADRVSYSLATTVDADSTQEMQALGKIGEEDDSPESVYDMAVQANQREAAGYNDFNEPSAEVAEQVTAHKSVMSTDAEPFNVEAKRRAVVDLVERAALFMQKNDLDHAFNAFTHGKEFLKGELYMFVFECKDPETRGICLAHGQEESLVWQNLWNLQDSYGTYAIRDIVKKAESGGGWLTYQWRNATKVSYIKMIEKSGKCFAIGCGYYPHSKADAVVNLVKAAVAYFNQVVNEKDFPADEVFSTLSYPIGRFITGDLYLYAMNFDGIMMAQGDRPGLIGSNSINIQDANGKLVNQEIITQLRQHPEGIWTKYKSKNADKMTYAEKVTDKKGTDYFIACGYYPGADRQAVVNLVKDGYTFMKKEGKTAAIEEFSDKRHDRFRFGDLYMFVYDTNGVCIANGYNADLIGSNQYNLKDDDGTYMIQDLIKKAQAGGGWLDFKLKNAFQAVYVEMIDLGIEKFVIGSGLYPISKRETAILLGRSAASYLRSLRPEVAFREFTKKDGKYIRGDLSIFVTDFNGICRVYGDEDDLIWRNLMNLKDDEGKPFVKLLINTAAQGGGQVTYTLNGNRRVSFVEMVEKDDSKYMIGTGYYL